MRQKLVPRISLLAALMGTALCAGQALAQLSEDDQAILEEFFIAANGESWRRNDGWLEPGSDPCDWYGVECQDRSTIERSIVRALALPANNLSGTLDARIFDIVHRRLDLSDNAIGGELEFIPTSPDEIDLSNNRLSGTLRTEAGTQTNSHTGSPHPYSNWYLDLSGNDFEGEIPSSWYGPVWLNLSGNRFEGMPQSLLDGTRYPLDGQFLDLSDNRFSGELAASIMDSSFLLHNGPSRWGGGINLCWNDWSLPESAEFHEWLENHHVGGEYERCLSGERQPIDPAISGSWYDPDRSGEGNAVQVLDNGMILNYFFTFDQDGNQQWLVGIDPAAENSVSWRELLRTKGRFDSGLLEPEEDAIEVRGSFRIDRLDSNRVLAERVYIDEFSDICLAVYPPPLSCFGSSLSDRREYQRLSNLAGTTCGNQSIHQEYSGAWYNPERSGEGFILEVLPDDRAVIYWFTYRPDDSGQQAWIVGVGAFEGGGVVIGTPPPDHPVASLDFDAMVQPVGTAFGPKFDSNEIDNVDWGSLRLEFYQDGSGKVSWDSRLDEYGAGEYPIERLARPKLAECEQ